MAKKKIVKPIDLPEGNLRQFDEVQTYEVAPEQIYNIEPEETDTGYGELWEAAKYRGWVSESLKRQANVYESSYDMNYKTDAKQLESLQQSGYTPEEIDFVAQSTSQANMALRLSQIDTDRQKKRLLESAGWKGTGMELLAGIADPSMIPLMLLSGGGAAAAKVNTIRAVGMSMLEGASIGVGTEYLLKQGDTQRTTKDLYLAAVGGAVLSGAVTGVARGFGAFKPKTPELELKLKNQNEADMMHNAAVREHMDGNSYARADDAMAASRYDADSRKVFLSEKDIVEQLKLEHGERVDTLSRSKVEKVKGEFREYAKAKSEQIAKLKANKFLKPSAKNKQIAQLEEAVARRRSVMDEALKTSSDAKDSNIALDQLNNGKIPEQYRERYMELKAENGEFEMHPAKVGETLPKREPVKADAESDVGGTASPQSMGAMRVKRNFQDIETFDDLIPTSEVDEIAEATRKAQKFGMEIPRISRMSRGRGGLFRLAKSMSTEIDEAPDAATRGLGAQLFKNGSRTISGHQSAEELAETLFHRAAPHYMEHEVAFDAFARQRGIGLLSSERSAMREEFDKLVVARQLEGLDNNMPNPSDDAITQAAKARARIYEMGLKNYKDYNVVGFDKIEHRNDYHSVVFDLPKILKMQDTHADDVVNLIARAYETGGIKVSRENAVRIAQMQLERTSRIQGSNRGLGKSVLSDTEFKIVADELSAKGVEPEVIEELKSHMFNLEDKDAMNPRAMFSLRPNLNAGVRGLHMLDLVDTSIDRVMKYVSDSSASAGLASQGYRSRFQLERALSDIHATALNQMRHEAASSNPKIAKRAQDELAKIEKGEYTDLIMNGVKLMFREPLESKGNDIINDVSKQVRRWTSIERLRMTGFTTLPEYGTAMQRVGAMNLLSQIPNGRFFNLKDTSVEADSFMKEFGKTFSATGHQEYMFGHQFYNGSDFDDVTKGKLAQALDKFTGHVSKAAMTVNLFRTIQHGGEELVARAMVKNIHEAVKTGAVTPNLRKSLIKIGGMSEEGVDEMVKAMKAFGGDDVFAMARSLPPKAYNELSTAMRNTLSGSFMRMGIGEQPAYLNREVGKFLFSLQTFSVGAYEKMLVRGIRNEPALMAVAVTAQAALGLAAQTATVYSKAQTMPEDKRQKFIDKSMKSDALFFAAMDKVSYFAPLQMGLQMATAVGLMPDDLVASKDQAGFRGAQFGAPFSMAADVVRGVNGASQMIKTGITGEYMPRRDYEEHARDLRRVIPLIDTPVYNWTIGQLE